MSTSFEEKSVWIQLVSLLAVFGGYFALAWLMFSQGVTVLAAYVPLFIAAVVLLVIVLSVGHSVAAIVSKPEGRDERDQLIEWRGESNSAWILGAGVILAIMGLIVSLDTVLVAHLLFLSLFFSQIASYIFRLVCYRRGV